MIKVVTIVGARPQFIKAATVSRAIARFNQNTGQQKQIHEVIVHTGQHYDANMSRIFFEELQIPAPDYNLGIGSGGHGLQTGRMLGAIEEVLLKEKPQVVITYGDTNSTAAGVLAAVKLHIPSAHIEAGLRSYNRRMPEEINRLIADELSNILFCPTQTAVSNLEKEGIVSNYAAELCELDLDHRLVRNAGDVMYDSILFNKALAEEKSDILGQLNLLIDNAAGGSQKNQPGNVKPYFLATVHRAENTDELDKLQSIFDAFQQIADAGYDVILPMHPRTRARIKAAGFPFDRLNPVEKRGSLRLIAPIGYLDMIRLESQAKAILTDSGGVQKEAFLLRIPCITLREETEWVETVASGWNILTGCDADKIGQAFSRISRWNGTGQPLGCADAQRRKTNQSAPGAAIGTPYGTGAAATTIVDTLAASFF